ncbi:MAG: HesA/MoeB/ThiF family protein [Pseudomonadota bacterium]|nr:HesA/MoeB/ThiF family protein [Pseudomonadota bacterium]
MVVNFLKASAVEGDLIPLAVYERAARKFSLTFREIEELILENGLFPLRYQRQRKLLAIWGQLRLLRSRVAVVGCGGLGGSVFEMLVRLGVGCLLVIDPDFFVESNLNRQFLATTATLGRYKAEVARERGVIINPVVTVEVLNQSFQSERGVQFLASCDLVFDALDSIPLRLQLAELCSAHDLFLVHGAVDGWYGQVAPIAPASETMAQIYPRAAPKAPSTGLEKPVGNLSPTVNAVAALQVSAGLARLLDAQATSWSTGCFLDLLVPELDLWS